MRKLIIYGNCQAGAISSMARAVPALADNFDIVYHELWSTGEELDRQIADFAAADIFLCQNVRNWRTHPLANKLPADLKIVRFPFCYFAALWPFDAFTFGSDNPMVAAMTAWPTPDFPFGMQDGLLGRLRSEIPDPAERMARYRSLDISGLPDIRRYAEFECARVLAEDKRLGFSIGRFVVDNYRTERLFHVVVHPAKPLMIRLTAEVLSKLNVFIAPDEMPEYPDYLARCQVPLHPHVIDTLGLEWVTADSTYRQINGEYKNFEEYFTSYIGWPC